MIITQKLIIELDGPDGTTEALLAMARRFAAALGLSWERVLADMTDGTRADLIVAFDRYFGEYVTLTKPPLLDGRRARRVRRRSERRSSER